MKSMSSNSNLVDFFLEKIRLKEFMNSGINFFTKRCLNLEEVNLYRRTREVVGLDSCQISWNIFVDGCGTDGRTESLRTREWKDMSSMQVEALGPRTCCISCNMV